MTIWGWLMDLWFGPVKPEQRVETFTSDFNTTPIEPKPAKKSTKKPKATIEGDAKLLYSNNKEKQQVLPTPRKPKDKKGK